MSASPATVPPLGGAGASIATIPEDGAAPGEGASHVDGEDLEEPEVDLALEPTPREPPPEYEYLHTVKGMTRSKATQRELDTACFLEAGPSGSTERLLQALRLGGLPSAHTSSLGETALHMAAASGHDDRVAHLVAFMADLDVGTFDRRRAMHDAAEGGHYAIVERLIRAGAHAHPETITDKMPRMLVQDRKGRYSRSHERTLALLHDDRLHAQHWPRRGELRAERVGEAGVAAAAWARHLAEEATAKAEARALAERERRARNAVKEAIIKQREEEAALLEGSDEEYSGSDY